MTEIVRFRVYGRVQGVGFRAHCQRIAVAQQLRGWAINGEDGSVDVLLIGESAKIAAAKALIVAGPARAQVAFIEPGNAPEKLPQSGFFTR